MGFPDKARARGSRALGLLVAALAVPACDDASSAVVTPALLQAGGATYAVSCAPCHGTSGKGDGPSAVVVRPRNHTDAALMDPLTDADIARVVREGGAPQGMPYMPAQPHIRGADLVALVAYVRSLSRAGLERVELRVADWE